MRSSSAEKAYSRAGSLPQEIVVGHKTVVPSSSNVGASLLAKAVCQAPSLSDKQQKTRKLSPSGFFVIASSISG
ncbi:hypothetical protein DBR24_15990 [Pseudomonas sp. HMWF006]|nr:hypothetical protein DBR24_15990 [Pseudomonas sp. HMWF006]PTT62753.1 hypothetical protein DBR26_23940 [Pseudomonas sp. HMWF007]PTT88726.1 hypothetical protein DBR29_17195 [Pseudomonas sp. HMWF005]